MKRIVLILALLPMICSSCIWNNNKDNAKPTQRGHEIFSSWDEAMRYGVNENLLYPVFSLNAWLAADEATRPIIMARDFPSTEVEETPAGVFSLCSGYGTLVVNTNGTLLTDASARWTAELISRGISFPFFQGNDISLVINNLGANIWQITSDTARNGASLDWQLYIPYYAGGCFYDYAFEVEGTGTFVCDEDTSSPVALQYEISVPFANDAHDAASRRWRSGEVKLTATKEGNENQNVKAKVAGDVLTITYGGVAEEWPY